MNDTDPGFEYFELLNNLKLQRRLKIFFIVL